MLTLNYLKLQELILQLVRHSAGDFSFDLAKLQVLLFICDYKHFSKTKTSITGLNYRMVYKLPVCEHFDQTLNELCSLGYILRVQKENQVRFQIAIADSKLEATLGQSILDIIQEFWGRSASELQAHFLSLNLAVTLAQENELIPYTLALIGSRALSTEEVKYGSNLESLAAACLLK